MLQHLRDNTGDENLSKMISIAIVFVVGALVVGMMTWGMSGPVHNWSSHVVGGWYSDGSNEQDQFSQLERNANGTYKGVYYVAEWQGKIYIARQDSVANATASSNVKHDIYDTNGNYLGTGNIQNGLNISPDGMYVESTKQNGFVYKATSQDDLPVDLP